MKKERDLKEQLIRKGNKKAFESFYLQHSQSLIAYLQMLVRDPEQAKDIAQQSFIQLWLKATDIPKDVPLKKYLFGIAKNRFIDQYRAKKKENQLLEQLKMEAMEEYHLEEAQDMTPKLELMQLAMESLPPRCREILLLSKMEGVAYKEIAERLNISVKTVEAQMRIAYIKIREYDTQNKK